MTGIKVYSTTMEDTATIAVDTGMRGEMTVIMGENTAIGLDRGQDRWQIMCRSHLLIALKWQT